MTPLISDLHPGVTIYFVRHGETDWNAAQRYQGQTDIPLNAKGRAQAARNGRCLLENLGRAMTVDFVSSPLSRTRETMSIIRQTIGLMPLETPTDGRLKEQHFGHWEGQLWSELPTTDPSGFAARQADVWGWTPNGGENYQMLTDRVRPWLASIKRDTVVVSHGNVSRTVRGLVLGLDPIAIPKLECPQDKVLVLKDRTATWI
jgi:broad specificity phosphatase PhoE